MKFVLLLPFLVVLTSAIPADLGYVISSNETRKEGDSEVGKKNDPIIDEMNISSNISNRFATTLIESKVKNPATSAKQTTFSVILPEKAFISEFVMNIGGKSYKAYVKEKEEAKKIYDEAVSTGQSAAHVSVSARDSNLFTVSVNVEAEAKATFLLTYEELLERKNDQYELVLNIHPGQLVKTLNVEVHINESRPLVFVRTPSLRSGNEVSKEDKTIDPEADIETINSTSAIVKFQPTIEKQKLFGKELTKNEAAGLSGQFVVQYDVERDPHGGEILLKDGYFVHFFAPKDLQSLSKNVFFILDTSGSMWGDKIKNLKDAMKSILDEIKPEDTVSIIEFNDGAYVWNLETQNATPVVFEDYYEPFQHIQKHDLPGPAPATKELIENAKTVVGKMEANGGTYMIGGLEVGLFLVKSEIERTKSENKKQPLIIFLTDGDPNVGLYSTEEITKVFTKLNKNGIDVPLFSLSFGEGADKTFLRALSLKNYGFSRHIYDAADASLQLQEFYKLISSPVLSHLNFTYNPDAEEITKIDHPILFRGSEIVVAGKFIGDKIDAEVEALGPIGPVSLVPKIAAPVSSLERLWAYLTVKDTLEKRDIAENKTELTKKALDIALKYSFVTDVSSLVVVKPNETTAVQTEDASQPNSNFNIPLYSNKLGAPSYAPALIVGGGSAGYGGGGFAGYGGGYLTTPVAYSLPAPASTFASENLPEVDRSEFTFEAISTESTVEPQLKDVLPWLTSALNGTKLLTLSTGQYELGDSSLDIPGINKCQNTPKSEEGICRLIKDCPEVHNLLTTFEEYKKSFCPINIYAGVCCPQK